MTILYQTNNRNFIFYFLRKMNYKEINLFEGAMKSILPSAYMDVRY